MSTRGALVVVVCLLPGVLGCHGARDGAVAPNSVDVSAAHLRGDLDDDGNPSVADAIGILRIVVGLDVDSPAADADADGSTGIADAIAVLRCVVGLAQWPLGEWRPPPTRTVSGTVVETDFVVGANDRVECDGDVVIQCDTATIAGELYGPNATGYGEDGASIRIEAQGDIVVTGEVSAGDGGIGDEDGAGGDGGDVDLVSASGGITIGSEAGGSAVRTAQDVVNTVAAGNAGDGGDGLLGGAGGEGGVVTLEARNGTVTIHQAPGLIGVGNGGDGGKCVVLGDDLAGFEIPEQLNNAGGDSGGLVVLCDTLAGVETHDTGNTYGGKPLYLAVLDEGVGYGGNGGAAGNLYYAVDPTTDEPLAPATVSATARVRPGQTPQTETVVGAGGGDGLQEGGPGGTVSVCNMWKSAPGGCDANRLHVTGGEGGMAAVPVHGEEGVVAVDFQLWKAEFRGGEGGRALAFGYQGGQGARCSTGGRGGNATAVGGRGGHVSEIPIAVDPPPVYKPGVGGYAFARGGFGGQTGSCCSPDGPGAVGARGGDATALGGSGGGVLSGLQEPSPIARGGDARAEGGDGADGGSGYPPGAGGAGGEATATPGLPYANSLGEEDGDAGDPGEACPRPDEPGPTEVKGRLFDTQGGPVAGWGVKNNFLGVGGQSLAGEVQVQFTGTPTVSDGTGRYVYGSVPEGSWQVYPAPAPAGLYWVPAFRFYTKQAGTGIGGQDFQQAVAQQVDVTIPVRDQNDNPVEGATVDMWLQTGLRYSAWTCSLGLAQFTGVWSGYYQAEVKAPAPPAGYEWDPDVMDIDVGTDDMEIEPFRLRPTF